MRSRDFCYWLQGYFEISSAEGKPVMTEARLQLIRSHLAMVFKHEIDPTLGSVASVEELMKVGHPLSDSQVKLNC